MNINNIREGMEIKNYRELCRILEIPQKTGRSKEIQINNIRNYIELKKEDKSRKYIIGKIKENALETSADIEQIKERSYTKLIELLLIAYMIGEKEFVCTYTYNQLINILCMANNINRLYQEGGYELFCKLIAYVNFNTYRDFRQDSYGGIKKKIKYALESMSHRKLIRYKEVWHVCVLDANGNKVYRQPTNNEIRCELKICQELLLKYQCSDINALDDKKVKNSYESERSKRLKEELGWLFEYYKIELVKHIEFPDYILDETKKMLYTEAEKINLQIKSEELNNAIVNMIHNTGMNNHNNAVKRLNEWYDNNGWGQKDVTMPKSLKSISYRADEEYIDEWDKLVAYFIKCETNNGVEDH